jgi:tetratricopeptide (TPR) repeat protein
VANFTKGFCELFLLEPAKALSSFREAAQLGAADRANKALLSFAYSGVGIALLYLCQLTEARKAFLCALNYARRVGDDVRASTMTANLCIVEGYLGKYDDAIRYGEMSVAWAATNSRRNPVLGGTHTNLADVYVLIGRADKALQCIEAAEGALGSTRPRWRDRCAIVTSRAALALVQGNLNLALDLIGQIEGLARGREDAFPQPGPMWKLKLFRSAHLGSAKEALASASNVGKILRAKCPFDYLDVLAVKAWLERQVHGRYTAQTEAELQIFETLEAKGKRALLVAQGFLS